jgi:hypothetical protein
MNSSASRPSRVTHALALSICLQDCVAVVGLEPVPDVDARRGGLEALADRA